MSRILIVGSAGQLGQELQQTLIPYGEVVAVDRKTLDLSQPDQIRELVQQVQPQIVINAAAYTAVDQAEKEPETARMINAIAPTILAQEVEKLKAILIHVSTDYVFDGSKNHPYTEEDITNPLSIYGQSKLAGEQGIQENCQSYLILRTAWVYGAYGKSNFVKTMLRLGSEREEVRVVTDQIGTPTWAKDIADAIAQVTSLKPDPGIYHYTNSGVASWYDFAVAIFEEAKNLVPLKVQRVIPITTSEYPTPAQRPTYSVLSCRKISSVLNTNPPHWRQELRQMLKSVNS
ncbi:dTDP-4-dehydrorhamnose reductase [Crinalium epipsammum PCC 9333]|uniref:dTDP-4-dehydrorhamnose reductase n=1 Tax=Crinalium epipsammum PCC 9333 TaxID=1173022 RepID=K9VYQ9_9CYAN|nr:dTDP-4-dehydrorhamnose reductase [Crinalium epipsammum]AFZ12674.1 dTDP-4-dehydrorhamnose reductase [Crinalium epipsammum PCC 9333]